MVWKSVLFISNQSKKGKPESSKNTFGKTFSEKQIGEAVLQK